MQKVLVVVGMPASGKNIARDYSTAKRIPYLSTGDIVREECRKRGLEPDAESCKAISDELRGIDPAELTNRLITTVKEKYQAMPMVVLEGMRSWEEIESLKKHFQVSICAFVLPRSVRKKRLVARGRPEDDPSRFDERDMREIRYGTSVPIAMADHYILNEGTVEESSRKFARIVADFMLGGSF
jgi:dephospho-CoA kinase